MLGRADYMVAATCSRLQPEAVVGAHCVCVCSCCISCCFLLAVAQLCPALLRSAVLLSVAPSPVQHSQRLCSALQWQISLPLDTHSASRHIPHTVLRCSRLRVSAVCLVLASHRCVAASAGASSHRAATESSNDSHLSPFNVSDTTARRTTLASTAISEAAPSGRRCTCLPCRAASARPFERTGTEGGSES